MAAGLGFKTFTTGEVLTAGDVNGYLMQGVLVFASAAARNSAITSPQEGQFAYTKDTNSLWYYDGAAWVASGATGDIEGVTAGVGISGGGTSGTITVTNDMATTITAAGDIVVGTGSGTYDNLPIGTTAQVLTADTTVSPYKVKWATPAAGGGMTSLASGSFSGSALTLSSISQSYKDLVLVVRNLQMGTTQTSCNLKFNSTSSIYAYEGNQSDSGTVTFRGSYSNTNSFIMHSSLDDGNNKNVSNLTIFDYADTTSNKICRETFFSKEGGGDTLVVGDRQTGVNATTAISEINLTTSSGTFAGGTYVLYGVN